jgi:phosphate transport system permease protein
MLSFFGYRLGKKRSLAIVAGKVRYLHSLPAFYGFYTGLWSIIPALLVMVVWLSFETAWIANAVIAELPETMKELPKSSLYLVFNDIKNAANSTADATQTDKVIRDAAEHYQRLQRLSHNLLALVAIALSFGGIWFSSQRINKDLRARNAVEKAMTVMMVLCSTIAIFTTVGIVFSVLFESIRFFKSVPVADFLFGLEWSPQTAMRSDQVGSSGAFGAVPLFTGTLLVSLIAMVVAVPIGLMSAIYLSEFASPRFRVAAKPAL